MKKFFAFILAMAMIAAMASVSFASDVVIGYNEAYVLKFDCDDEIEIAFGDDAGDPNEGVFTVDVSGQDKLFIAFNTTPNETISAANEGKELFFVNFCGVRFNRTGEYVYELSDYDGIYSEELLIAMAESVK